MRATAIPEMLNIPKVADDVPERRRVRSRATGVLVLSRFGALWTGAGIRLSSAQAWAWVVLAMLVVAFGVRGRRLLRANPRVAEPLALEPAERQRLDFLPLAVAFDYRPHIVTARRAVIRTGNTSAPSATRWPVRR
jgi:hypothetical protein